MRPRTAWLLTLGIVVAIVADGADFFFRRPYYEFWDLAANSLAINRAKHFVELYGSYSRWGFHHPGPVFFYVQAFGEWLFYDLLHLSPAPFNAQTLANLCVTTSFFVASVAAFSRWVSEAARRWFVPAALAVGAVHFGAVSRVPSYDMLLGSSVFSSAWTAHSWVFPFLCVVTAGASVAAGRGEDLVLLAVADGFLIHAHIASPLFVGPMTLLAYAGLLHTTMRREAGAAETNGRVSLPVRWQKARRGVGSAWRAFPGTHVIALAILAVFALPIVIDLFLGDESNIHAVLMHMRSHHGEHKSFMRSLFYFGQFGAYRAYQVHFHEFKRFDKAGAYAYLWLHRKIYAMWFIAILLAAWTSAVRPALVALGRWRDDAPAGAMSPRTRLLAWAGAFLALSIVLTLYWGIIQDGGMFYYSGWINFAIYYFGLLIILAEFSSVLAAAIPRWKNGALLASPAWRWIERFVPAGVVAFACFMEAGRFRVSDPTPWINRTMHESFVQVVQDAKARNPKGIKMLKFPILTWPTLTGLALEMQREGQPFMVASIHPVAFPPSLGLRATTRQEEEIMEVWHFKVGRHYKLWVSGVPKWFVPFGNLLKDQLAEAKRTKSAEGEPMFYPLLDDVELRISLPRLDPNVAGGSSLDFRKHDNAEKDESYGYYRHKDYSVLLQELGSNHGCVLYGFSEPEDWGMWNEGPGAALRLRGAPVRVGDDVEICLDAHPFLAPLAHVTQQHLFLSVDGTQVGPPTCLTEDDEVIYRVPGTFWNRTLGRDAGAALVFRFPDIASPADTDPDGNSDTRQLGVGLRGIRFRAVPAEHPQPALDLDGADRSEEIDFKPGGNAPTFQAEGWSDPEPWGTWSNGHTSRLHFHGKLIEGTREVEVALKLHSVMRTDSPVKGQRVRLLLGDDAVDHQRTVQADGTLTFTISSATWNAAVADNAEAVLNIDLPDAVSPARLDPTGKENDGRLLAIGVESIGFRQVPGPSVSAR